MQGGGGDKEKKEEKKKKRCAKPPRLADPRGERPSRGPKPGLGVRSSTLTLCLVSRHEAQPLTRVGKKKKKGNGATKNAKTPAIYPTQKCRLVTPLRPAPRPPEAAFIQRWSGSPPTLAAVGLCGFVAVGQKHCEAVRSL